MKIKFWPVYIALISTSVLAQEVSNPPPAAPIAAPAVAPAPELQPPPAKTNSPAKKPAKKKAAAETIETIETVASPIMNNPTFLILFS